MNKWRPIKSAPKDGTHILLSGRVLPEDDILVVLGLYVKGNHNKWNFYNHFDESWDAFLNERPPTHWIPLPKAPK